MNKKGFTLIELVIVLVITLVMFGAASISFLSLERQRLCKSANILCANLRYCQKNAMDEKRKYELSFNVVDNLYYIKRADESGLLKKISQVKLPAGITVSTNAKENSIAYTIQGTSGDACTITLRGKKYFLKITVNVGSGRVKINQVEKLLS